MSIRHWVAILGGALGAFMAILDIQVTNASIREISGALSLDISQSGWISSAYLISEIVVIPLTAFLSEVFGSKRYMLLNCLGFIVASAFCGMSWNPTSLIIFRSLQGLTGGTLIPMSFQLILKLMPEKLRPIGITIFGLTVTLAPTLGPSLGGWLTDQYGWRSIFFINIFPGVLMLWSIWYGLEWSVPKWQNLRKLDILSVICLVLGLATLTYILEEGPKEEWFDNFWIRIHFLICIMTLPLFIVRQFEIKTPVLNLRLLSDHNFALGTIITTLAGCALFSGIYSLSLFLGQVKDYSAAQIGNVLMWVGLPQLLIMPFIPWLMRKVDLRLLAMIGIGLFAYSNWMNVGLSQNFTGEEFISSLFLRAFGQPLFVIPLSVMAMTTIAQEQSGDASAIFNVMRNLGASLGIALTSTFLLTRQSAHFTINSERLSAYDFGLMQKFYDTDKYFRWQGLDGATATNKAFQKIIEPFVTSSIVAAFSDIYFVLTWCLLICIGIVFLMKKVSGSGSESSLH